MQVKKSTQRIYCLGETVLDLVFQSGQLQVANPGGSVLNAASSLVALGRTVELISECGMDPAGALILSALQERGVGTRYLHRYRDYPTALVQAGLDAHGQPSYTFSKLYPPVRLEFESLPDFKAGDVLLFGSGAALDPALRDAYGRILSKARSAGVFVVYDPNLRPAYADRKAQWWEFWQQNCKWAHVVKASKEDLEIALGQAEIGDYGSLIQGYGADLVLTDAHRPVHIYTHTVQIQVPVAQVAVLSAIGAGDTFNAGLVDAWLRNGKVWSDLQEQDWLEIVGHASHMAALVCGSQSNSLQVEWL